MALDSSHVNTQLVGCALVEPKALHALRLRVHGLRYLGFGLGFSVHMLRLNVYSGS